MRTSDDGVLEGDAGTGDLKDVARGGDVLFELRAARKFTTLICAHVA